MAVLTKKRSLLERSGWSTFA